VLFFTIGAFPPEAFVIAGAAAGDAPEELEAGGAGGGAGLPRPLGKGPLATLGTGEPALDAGRVSIVAG
jgi:hypothetical protein